MGYQTGTGTARQRPVAWKIGIWGVGGLVFLIAVIIQGCTLPIFGNGQPSPIGSGRYRADVWADNWFALYSGTILVGEDSVPVTTERSFNAETIFFDAEWPLTLNLVAKDFKENDTGLENIGKTNQQVGDGGVILQVTDTRTGKVVAVTDGRTRCLVIHRAPLRPACASLKNPSVTDCGATIGEEPSGWKSPNFDVTALLKATVYSEADVGVKDGYLGITWDRSAKLVWAGDLKLDNTILCRVPLLTSTP
ncbi:MAG: PEBP family protein [Chloroflexi bacterium]|nr:PEBP family protein [Chloroflexota bacterium]